MFHISNKKIFPGDLISRFDNPEAGAVVTFEGKVRNHNDGKRVSSLEYQCYKPMAIKEGNNILNDAAKIFDVLDVYCIHAEGHLQIGDIAVWIIVTSKHRKAAYEANQYIIDKVKSCVPIWKREHYVNEDPIWVACHQCGGGHHAI
ncbi:MAG: molybdenum cofactor biosynthesis protein MoaE [Halobacteriovoraceae bacterium]|nr:molybdenum cofactor biosynthesis protein MoaE [Halobacteriovoraceae bacterium]